MSNPTTSPTSTSQTPPTSTVIKLLHQELGLKKYSGEDLAYSALTFFDSWDDTILNTNVTSDADKTAFVRSELVPDSLAADMMGASVFLPKQINYDFKKFKENFLQVFGFQQYHDTLQWDFRLAGLLTNQLGTSDYLVAQTRAADIANEAVHSLNNGSWLENCTLSDTKLPSLYELTFYSISYTPREAHCFLLWF